MAQNEEDTFPPSHNSVCNLALMSGGRVYNATRNIIGGSYGDHNSVCNQALMSGGRVYDATRNIIGGSYDDFVFEDSRSPKEWKTSGEEAVFDNAGGGCIPTDEVFDDHGILTKKDSFDDYVLNANNIHLKEDTLSPTKKASRNPNVSNDFNRKSDQYCLEKNSPPPKADFVQPTFKMSESVPIEDVVSPDSPPPPLPEKRSRLLKDKIKQDDMRDCRRDKMRKILKKKPTPEICRHPTLNSRHTTNTLSSKEWKWFKIFLLVAIVGTLVIIGVMCSWLTVSLAYI